MLTPAKNAPPLLITLNYQARALHGLSWHVCGKRGLSWSKIYVTRMQQSGIRGKSCTTSWIALRSIEATPLAID